MRSHAGSSGVASSGAMIVALVLMLGSSFADADGGRYVIPFPDDLPDFIYDGTFLTRTARIFWSVPSANPIDTRPRWPS